MNPNASRRSLICCTEIDKGTQCTYCTEAVSLHTAILLFNLTQIQVFFFPSLCSAFFLLNFSCLLLLSFLLTFLPYLFPRSFHFLVPSFSLFLPLFEFSWYLNYSFISFLFSLPDGCLPSHTWRAQYSQTSNSQPTGQLQHKSLKTWTQYLLSEFEPVTTKSKRPRRSLVPVGDSWSIQLFQLFFFYLH